MNNLPGLLLGVLIFVILAGLMVLFIGSLVSVLRSSLSAGMKLVWFVLIFALPLIGSVLWVLIGRSHAASPVLRQ
jgi:Phospholipase_D-nuclease N-terminal